MFWCGVSPIIENFCDAEFYKSATRRNFEVRKSEHVCEKVKGVWGTTTYVGPMTWSLAIIAAPTVIGFILIMLFFPVDERDVYLHDGKFSFNLHCGDISTVDLFCISIEESHLFLLFLWNSSVVTART